ncbi:proton-coupled zinc antiporter SLC30A2-like [Lampris incognitus]|uniref:proton-coupled zinc antiporter SLC30A2-like n=1 Tax=Lampris incognitus TaxID=2546036 RepID=UPI0024B5600B|nr:proton-coupled zinc antiporter SLC30A2-like [Lampris incognitus]
MKAIELSTDLEKHRLLGDPPDTHSEPFCRTFRRVAGENSRSTEDGEDASSDGDIWEADGHCHKDSAGRRADVREKRRAKRTLLIATVVSLVFMTGEVIGGYAADSLAIMTDAAHLFTDVASFILSLLSLWISSRPHTKTMTFGWHRAEILGALMSVLSIWVVTGVLVYLAVLRIINDDYEIRGFIMVITSGCAVAVNILMALILHQPGVSHGHSHGLPSSQPAQCGEDRGHVNTSVRAAFIHVVGDLLQSAGVLVAAIIIYFQPHLKIADPICTFLFSVLVLGTTLRILKDVFRILMEGAPSGVHFNTVRELLLTVRGIRTTHNLHLWGLSMSHSLLSVHVAVEKDADAQSVLMEATKLLHSEFGFSSVTIQVEHYSEDMSHCSQCQQLTD